MQCNYLKYNYLIFRTPLKIIVGGEAYISLGLCAYSGSSANITLAGADKTAISSISAKASSDGKIGSFHYTGEAGTLYITFDGTTYLHSLAINNIADATVSEGSNGYYNVKAGDANAFLKTLAVANANSSSEKRTCIYLPDGTYDPHKPLQTILRVLVKIIEVAHISFDKEKVH